MPRTVRSSSRRAGASPQPQDLALHGPHGRDRSRRADPSSRPDQQPAARTTTGATAGWSPSARRTPAHRPAGRFERRGRGRGGRSTPAAGGGVEQGPHEEAVVDLVVAGHPDRAAHAGGDVGLELARPPAREPLHLEAEPALEARRAPRPRPGRRRRRPPPGSREGR